MPKPAAPLTALLALCLAAAPPLAAAAESASATARIGGGQTVEARAAPVAGEGVLLEFLLPDGRTQSFPALGEALVPIDGRAGPGLLARDVNGDGIDEVVIRGSVPPERGALLVFRWEASEFAPIPFTDDRDRTHPFAVVDPREPVLLRPDGTIEVHFETARPDGRKSHHVARYRWNGQEFTQSADN